MPTCDVRRGRFSKRLAMANHTHTWWCECKYVPFIVAVGPKLFFKVAVNTNNSYSVTELSLAQLIVSVSPSQVTSFPALSLWSYPGVWLLLSVWKITTQHVLWVHLKPFCPDLPSSHWAEQRYSSHVPRWCSCLKRSQAFPLPPQSMCTGKNTPSRSHLQWIHSGDDITLVLNILQDDFIGQTWRMWKSTN